MNKIIITIYYVSYYFVRYYFIYVQINLLVFYFVIKYTYIIFHLGNLMQNYCEYKLI